MATIYSSIEDGRLGSGNASTWAGARDIATATSFSSGDGQASSPVGTSFSSGRSGNNFSISRAFFLFDTSGISGSVTDASFQIYGYLLDDASMIAVKSTAFGGDGSSSLATSEIDSISGFSSGSSLDGSATVYSSNDFSENTFNENAYNDFGGSSSLRADMQNNDVVIICVMDKTHDYLNVAPTSTSDDGFTGLTFANYSGTDRDPKIVYTEASGYTHSISAVSAENIGKVNDLVTASIGKVNTVD
ncbi:MAG: hypothetical protein CMI60_16180 [Parvibaculum sp.]|nr:hypothetical protein [Parvibaculum sp.]